MTPEIHDGPDRSIHAEHSNVNRVEISERTLSVVAIVAAVAAFVTALWSIHESDRAARETRQLQIQVMDMNALALRNGWLLPRDLVYGPAGNHEFRPEQLPPLRPSDTGSAKSHN